MNACAHGVQKKASDPQELKLQVVVTGVLGNEFRSSSRGIHAFNH